MVGDKLVISDIRSRFVYPQDRSFVVYFEWDGPAGDHVLTAVWKGPDGKVVTISPDVRIQTVSSVLRSYWMFEVAPHMPSGYWSAEVRVDGQPAGSHHFELVVPAAKTPDPVEQPKAAAIATPDEVYRATRGSVAFVHRLDEEGRRVDTGSGFVLAEGVVATSFQIIDSAKRVEVEFEGAKPIATDAVVGYSRVQDWALLRVDTGDRKPIRRGDPAKVGVAERLLVFNVENGDTRAFGGVDVSGVRTMAGFGERLQFTPAVSAEAVGGPLLSTAGEVLGILGGTVVPGSRVDRRNLSVSPASYMPMNAPAAATTIHQVRANQPPTTLSGLHDAGFMSQPIRATASFVHGGTSRAFKNLPSGALPPNASEFSRRDAEVWVYTVWQRKDKVGKAVMSATVFDAQNRLRVTLAPKKIGIPAEAPARYGFAFAPKDLEAGSYRVDLLLDGKPVWRTFVTITE